MERHADEQAAVELAYYVIVPFLPDQRPRVDWRRLLRGGRGRLGTAALERSLAAHRRVARESLHLTDAIRADLERSISPPTCSTARRCSTCCGGASTRPPPIARRTAPGAREQRLEILGELDATAGAQEAARAARALRELVAASGIDWPDQRHLRVDRDLEQALYVATLPDATEFGWLLEAMQIPRAFTLSVHVHALDRLRERSRFKNRHRRLFGVNRGAELRGRTPDYEMLAQEAELGELLTELSGHERSAPFEVAIYQSIREPGPDPDPVALAEAVEHASQGITAASDARVNLGQLRQLELWQSTLPLGRDLARLTRTYLSRHVGDTVPLVGTGCGSPTGIPFAFTDPGRELALINPFDPAHDNGTLLVNARSGGGKTFLVNVLIARLLAHGMQAFVLDRAGHYAFLCALVPGARHLTIGASTGEHAVNPWDVENPASPPLEKIAYLVALHALLVGDHQANEDAYGLDALERNLLEVAIRAVYARAARENVVPRAAARAGAAPPRRARAPPAPGRRRRCAPSPSGSPRSSTRAPTPTCSTAKRPCPGTRRWSPSTRARSRASSPPRCCSCSPSTSPSGSSSAATSACARRTRACSPGGRCSSSTRRGSSSSAARPASGSTRSPAAPATSGCSWSRSASSSRTSPARTAAPCSQLHPAAVPAPVPRRARLHQGRRPALRRRGRRDCPPEDGQARLLAGLLDQRHPRPRRSPCASDRPSTDSPPRTPSATSRRTQLLDAEHGDAWRALERLATEGWDT